MEGEGNAENQKKGGPVTTRVDYKELLSPDDFALFSLLRAVRKKTAEAEGIPVYAVFTNDQLAQIARTRPGTVSDLEKIEGIGPGKSAKFSVTFLDSIQEHVKSASDRIPF